MTRLSRLADWAMRTPRRLWTIAFALFFALAASWSIATPLAASPDEPAHFIRAAAVVRGQINGPEVMVPHMVQGIKGQFSETGAQLPAWYQQMTTVQECYAFKSKEPAGCAPKLGDSQQIVQVTTAAGRYNPAYYLAVGWPSLLVKGPVGLYLMRLMSAVLSAMLLASAVVTAAESRRRSFSVLGVVAAATPMSLFLAGMVNPSSGEIASGILVWTAMLAILMAPDPRLLTRRLLRLGVGGLVLVNIRPLGPLWFVLALAFGLLLQERGAIRAVLRRKAAWLGAVVLAAATGVSVLWASAHPDHSVIHVPASLTWQVAAQKTFNYSYLYIKQMLGYFGWLDTPEPAIAQVISITAIAAMTVAALVLGRTRERLAVVGICVGIVLMPVVAQASQVSQIGLVWQGRYLLPFAVGLPLMTTLICIRRAPERGVLWQRPAWLRGVLRQWPAGLAAAALVVANLMAFYRALRRYAVGVDGPLLITHAHWQPPGGWLLWMAVYGAAALGLLTLTLAGDRALPRPGGERPEAGGSTRLGRRPGMTVIG